MMQSKALLLSASVITAESSHYAFCNQRIKMDPLKNDFLMPAICSTMSRNVKVLRSVSTNCLVALLASIGSSGTTLAETKADFVSTGGIGYISDCTSQGLKLSAIQSTTRLFGYRNSQHFEYFQSEEMLLKRDCTVISDELGDGNWCEAGGSNAGFTVTFIRSTGDDNHSFNVAEFYGQEAYCKSLEIACFCSDHTTD